MKLLYPYANVMGLFFPVGPLEKGGTCEFATKTCHEECCACQLDMGMGVEVSLKQEIYERIENISPEAIAEDIIAELKEAKCEILTWFSSGDCPSILTKRFFWLAGFLDARGIIQTGITRNKALWQKCKQLSSRAKVLLTIEKVDDSLERGIYSLPDYKTGAISIVEVGLGPVRISAGCGGGYYEDHVKILGIDTSHLKLDCKACHRNKTGCFITDVTVREASH
jgi:hypothetical protein